MDVDCSAECFSELLNMSVFIALPTVSSSSCLFIAKGIHCLSSAVISPTQLMRSAPMGVFFFFFPLPI